MLWIKCKQVYINGAREHFLQYYNFMDFAILALYMASYSLRLATYYRVTQASDHFNATTRILQAIADCSFIQMNNIIRETTDKHNYQHDQYAYFMVARMSVNQ